MDEPPSEPSTGPSTEPPAEPVTGPPADPLTLDPAELLARLGELPGGRELLAVAAVPGGWSEIELVGGAVRDIALGRRPRELDVAVGGVFPDAALALARTLAARLGPETQTTAHERFGTVLLAWPGGRIDIAAHRAESYPETGALPQARPAADLAEDLRRRDFTVNAIALTLAGPGAPAIQAFPGALEDLRARRLRVLHDESFRDDPTRLFRLARYRARLGFAIESGTATLAAEAVTSDALDTVSPARVGAELRLALGEADMVAALASIDDLGLLQALRAQLSFDEVSAETALGLLSEAGEGTRPDLLLIAMMLLPPGYHYRHFLDEEARRQMTRLLDDLEFSAPDRDRVMRAVFDRQAITEGLFAARTPADIYEVAALAPPEAVALAGLGLSHDERDNQVLVAARRWLTELRHIRLRITGDNLLAAGVPQGPEIGWRLNAALKRKLDGELADDRDAELAAALEA